MNLFTTLNEVLNTDVLDRIATYMDEPTEKTHKAIHGLVYTIVGGLMRRTTTEIGVHQLYSHIQKGHYDGSLTDQLGSVLRDPAQTNTLITQGNEVISHLLPAMKSSIGSMISGYAGIRNSSSISLLGLTTTVVLHVLGKQVKDRKLDADGLASSLFSEREAFVNAVPDELMPRLIEKIGLQQIVSGLATPARGTASDTPARPAPTVTRPTISYDPTDDTDSDTGSLAKWGVGALLALAIGAGGYYIYYNTQNHSGNTASTDVSSVITADTAQADTVTRSLAVPVDTTAKAVSKPAPATSPATSASAASTAAASTAAASTAAASTAAASTAAASTAGSLTQAMTPYLGNAALPKGRIFPLTGVAFLPGSLSLTAGSAATVNELATLLKTYPSLQVQLVGYANDAQGEMTNKSLSFKRVNIIKQQLVSAGINFLRVDAIGRGTGVGKPDPTVPAPPRPTLRKIDVKVVVK